MRRKTARAVDLIHGDAPDSLQRKEKRKHLKRDPFEKDRTMKIWVRFHSMLNFTEGQRDNGQTKVVVPQTGRYGFRSRFEVN